MRFSSYFFVSMVMFLTYSRNAIFGNELVAVQVWNGRAYIQLRDGYFGRVSRRADGRLQVRMADGTICVDGKQYTGAFKVSAKSVDAWVTSPVEPKIHRRTQESVLSAMEAVEKATDAKKRAKAERRLDRVAKQGWREGKGKVLSIVENRPYDQFNKEPIVGSTAFESPNEARERYGYPLLTFTVC